MDPVSAIGIASSVATFIEIGYKVSKRLIEYTNAAQDEIPQFLRSVSAQLPLLLNALGRIKSEQNAAGLDTDTRCIVRGVVSGCISLATDLEDIVNKISREKSDSIGVKLRKGLSSFKNEEKIKTIDTTLQTYVRVLILHHVVDSKEVPAMPVEDVKYFEVKEPVAKPFYARPKLLEKVHAALYDAARSQSQKPTTVVLVGKKGVGKSQLALNYCDEVKKLEQFQTTFWLNAKSVESLKLSLESAAATIRRSTLGSREEKLGFVNRFLTERWHPWLLVLDQYDHDKFEKQPLKDILPPDGYGAVLITTRNDAASTLGQSMNVGKFLTADEQEQCQIDLEKAVDDSNFEAVQRIVSRGVDVNSDDPKGQPFLSKAAQKGFAAAVDLFLQEGARLEPKPQAESALEYAAGQGHAKIVTKLLDQEDMLDTRLTKERYESAMYKAMYDGHAEIARLLVSRRQVSANVQIPKGGPMFCHAARFGHMELLKVFFELDAVPTEEAEKGRALHEAAELKNLDVLKYLINEKGFDPDWDNGYGFSALDAAVNTTEREVGEQLTRFLLDAGANPNLPARKCGCQPPIWTATFRHSDSIVQMLLDAGADPMRDDNDDERRTALKMAVFNYPGHKTIDIFLAAKIEDPNKHKAYWNEFLHHAVDDGNRDLVLRALEARPPNGDVDIDAKNADGNTPLYEAIRGRKVPAARMLIRHGANQRIPGGKGLLPLLLAADIDQHLVVRDLLKAQDSIGTEGARDEKGNSPLHLTAISGHETTMKVLLDAGADKDDMNKYGETVMDIAEQKGRERILKILAGASLQDLG